MKLYTKYLKKKTFFENDSEIYNQDFKDENLSKNNNTIPNKLLLYKIKKINSLNETIRNCRKCKLYKNVNQIVVGNGYIGSKILFITEQPNKDENEKGIPFCDSIGHFFNEMLEKFLDLSLEKIYVTNIIKCYNPEKEHPKESEIDKCFIHLTKQIEIINPKIICTLGKFSTSVLKKVAIDKVFISKIHGQTFTFKNITVVPTIHPAACLYNPTLNKPILAEDLKKINKLLNG